MWKHGNPRIVVGLGDPSALCARRKMGKRGTTPLTSVGTSLVGGPPLDGHQVQVAKGAG